MQQTVDSRQHSGEQRRTGAATVETELSDIVMHMMIQCFSVLAIRGILISDMTKAEIRKALYNTVHQSVEIEAKIVELMERPPVA